MLRLFSLFGFLLLLAPFYDSCNSKGMKENAVEVPVEEISPLVETDTISKGNVLIDKDTINNEIISEPTFFEKGYKFIDDSDTENAFELAYWSKNIIEAFLESSFNEFLKSCKEGILKREFCGLAMIISSLCFLIITVNTFMILLLSNFRRFRFICKLSLINLTCILIFFICVSFLPFFETYKQIKWGYYTFIIMQVFILLISRNLLEKPESN